MTDTRKYWTPAQALCAGLLVPGIWHILQGGKPVKGVLFFIFGIGVYWGLDFFGVLVALLSGVFAYRGAKTLHAESVAPPRG